jgi:predicted KAP-like P-loop ATPase
MGFWDKVLSIVRKQDVTPMVDATPEEPEQAMGPYRTDAPISDPRLDVFDREPFARRIADTIGERNDPSSIVVGIYGPWGDGKTTVLNFIRGRLKDYPSIICVSFNPWRMEGEQALLQGFFATLAEVLDKELTTSSEKLGDVLKKYGALLKVAPGGWGDAAVGAGTALSAVSLDELRDRISGMLREADRRVVIVMDDIDRLDRSEIQAIFRLVKLTGDFENTAYVLSFDEQMVAGAIGEKYASSSGQSYEAGINFLEKIVQVPLHLPPPSPDALRQYCFGLVDEALRESATEMSQNQVNEFVRHFIDGIQIRLKTPRMAKRYANALHFALTILKGETYTPDLLLVEGLRMFYPKLYDAIRHDSEPVLRTHSADRTNPDAGKFIEAHTEGMTAAEKRAAANLVEALFPRMGSTIIGSDWETEFAHDQRVASSYYFPRYFTEVFCGCAAAGDRGGIRRSVSRSDQRSQRRDHSLQAQISGRAASCGVCRSVD